MLKTADAGSQELSTQRHDTDGLKRTMVETLTPWKWANTSKQGFFFFYSLLPESWLLDA